jgi:hypothetical protein
MIGAFPRRGAWVTLQLAADAHAERLELLELLGPCPGDPGARVVRTTICEGAEDALAQAAARLRRGWAKYATADEPADRHDAAAALHAPAWAPAIAVSDTAVAPDLARAAIAHAASAAPQPFCLFPNPTAGRRS